MCVTLALVNWTSGYFRVPQNMICTNSRALQTTLLHKQWIFLNDSLDYM